MDAALRRGRLRLGNAEIFSRDEAGRALLRAIRRGDGFFNLPDMDFGTRDAAFVPFFGVAGGDAARAFAHGQGARHGRAAGGRRDPAGRRRAIASASRSRGPTSRATTRSPTAARMNRWIESEIRRNPAQYLWVHRRFKTRPPGEPSLY